MRKEKHCYHHGHLAKSLLDAVGEIASQYGLEAVTLRACAKRVGVSPSSAFRHYADKRALMTAFATRALKQLAQVISVASQKAQSREEGAFTAIGLAYIAFALDKPAFFRAMWREETIYNTDEHYVAAVNQVRQYLREGLSETSTGKPQELLAWSLIHGLATLFVEGLVDNGSSREQKLQMALAMLQTIGPGN